MLGDQCQPSKEKGLIDFFASSDFSEPPHVHVQREKFVAKFWLNPVALAKNRGFLVFYSRIEQDCKISGTK